MDRYDLLEQRLDDLEKTVEELIRRMDNMDTKTIKVLGQPSFTDGATTISDVI